MRLRPEGAAPRRGRFLIYALSATVLLIAGLLLTSRTGFLASRKLPIAAKVGAIGPDFTLQKAGEGTDLQLAALRGKPVVLNFFCGCGDCSEVATLWAERKKELGDAHVIAVMHDHTGYNPATLKNFRWASGFTWPVLADIGSDVSVAWKSLDCPIIWVLDAGGVIRYQSPGRGTPAEKHVADTLAALKAVAG